MPKNRNEPAKPVNSKMRGIGVQKQTLFRFHTPTPDSQMTAVPNGKKIGEGCYVTPCAPNSDGELY